MRTKPKRVLVVTDHMPWGHRSIAKAIYGFLITKEKALRQAQGFKVEYAEVKMRMERLNDLYLFAYRAIPSTNRITMRLMENERMRKMFLEVVDKNLPSLIGLIRSKKPDLVICAYYMYSQALARWRQKEGGRFKLWTVVADPWTINPVSFVEGADLHLVYDEVGKKMAIRMGIAPEKVLETGWWVREEMYDKQLKIKNYELKIKRRLGVEDERLVVFVGGGSLGTNSLTKFLPALMLVKKPVAIIFNTGTDKLLFNMVEEYRKLFNKLRKDNMVKIINLGWISNMAEVLSACDIVFGKAGPNFLFDVVAVGKPLVAITHLGGQEDGNIDLIRKKKLGWVREKRGEAVEMLLKFVENPQKYKKVYQKTVQKEAERNSRWGEIMWKELMTELRLS